MAIAVLGAGLLAGCGGDSSDDDSSGSDSSLPAAVVSLDELRDASVCPIAPSTSDLPDGVVLGAGDASVTDYDGGGVAVLCDVPIEPGAASDEVTALIVAAPEGADVRTMETDSGGSWRNTIYNSTGVEQEAITAAVDELRDDDVDVLEGIGESVAVKQLAVDGTDQGLLLVYGDDAWSGDQLAAIAESLREAPPVEGDEE